MELFHLQESLHAGIPERLREKESRVFSQFGEDGILSWLTRDFSDAERSFVEIGVGSYSEANTRLLSSKTHNPWRGVVIDCEPHHLNFGDHSESWRWNVKAVQALVTPANVNRIIEELRVPKDLGIFSLDIDGLDYWVWRSLNVVRPRIVILEFNYVFGKEVLVSIPEAENFVYREEDSSRQFFGGSLQAMILASKEKGYVFVGCGSAGVNAFFVRSDILCDVWPGFQAPDSTAEWTDAGFGNVWNGGELTRPDLADKQALIQNCVIFDLTSGRNRPLKEVFL
jgi:hypothetical protein